MSSLITGKEASLKVSQAMHPTGRISEPADVSLLAIERVETRRGVEVARRPDSEW
ncbi:MAG: hypothetical protein ABI689_04855 [Thermoanaerobaculia bacterium]